MIRIKSRSFVAFACLLLLQFCLVRFKCIVQAAETVVNNNNNGLPSEKFEESLKLKSLSNGLLFAHFEFTTTISSLSNYTRLFPRTLAEILDTHNVYELHLSLTQGYWRIESWGELGVDLPVTSSPGGAFVSAWFTAEDKVYVEFLYI